MGKEFTHSHQTRKLPIIVLSKIARFPGTIKTQKPLIDGHAALCPSYPNCLLQQAPGTSTGVIASLTRLVMSRAPIAE
jgi:uncharacterized protein (DUF1499 family)